MESSGSSVTVYTLMQRHENFIVPVFQNLIYFSVQKKNLFSMMKMSQAQFELVHPSSTSKIHDCVYISLFFGISLWIIMARLTNVAGGLFQLNSLMLFGHCQLLLKINSHTFTHIHTHTYVLSLCFFFSSTKPSVSPSPPLASLVCQSSKHTEAGRMNGTELLQRQRNVAANRI